MAKKQPPRRNLCTMCTNLGRAFGVVRFVSAVVVRQIVVHHIKRISFSLAEVLRFGIAC